MYNNGRVLYIETTTGQRPKTIRLEAQDARTGWRRYTPMCVAAERAHKGHSCAVYHNIIIMYYYSKCAAASVYGDSVLNRSCTRGVSAFTIYIYVLYLYLQFSEYRWIPQKRFVCEHHAPNSDNIHHRKRRDTHSLIRCAQCV